MTPTTSTVKSAINVRICGTPSVPGVDIDTPATALVPVLTATNHGFTSC